MPLAVPGVAEMTAGLQANEISRQFRQAFVRFLRPSDKPMVTLSPSTKARVVEALFGTRSNRSPMASGGISTSRKPTIGVALCWALVTRGQAAAVPPSKVMNSRRLISPPQPEIDSLPYPGGGVVHHSKWSAGIFVMGHEPTRAPQQKLVYSITSSARASSVGGTVRPSALAVLRLMINKNLVGKATGRSAGLAPLRILST